MTRLAILADIHGNLPALEAVLADLARERPDAVYLAGDQISRVPWHNEVMELIAAHGWPAIYGNHEWVIARLNTPEVTPPFTDRARFRSLYWTQETLHPEHLETIRSWPAELRIEPGGAPPLRLIHGIPGDSFQGIFPFTPSDTVAEMLRGVEEPCVLLGHTHRPMQRRVDAGRAGRWTLFNGGSVGLPFNGDPRAQYLLLDGAREGWRATFRAVEFDHAGLRTAFERSGALAAAGPLGDLHVRTAETAQPWSSDFAYWLHHRSGPPFASMEEALAAYLAVHGPGHWAFPGDLA